MPLSLKADLAERETVALVTGAAGFAGRHLVEALLRDTAWQIVGFSRRRSGIEDRRYREVTGEIQAEEPIRAALSETRPSYLFHLAAATPPAPDALLYATNVGGTANLLEAVQATTPRARVLIVGSDAQYGHLPPRHVPTTERATMRPVGAYGRSKVLQERNALDYRRMTGLHIVCVRPFNHIGPGQSDRFVVASLARQIAAAEAGLGPGSIRLGRTDTARDFTDVRDVVRAYLGVLVDGRPGAVYNVGSGAPRCIAEIAETLASFAQSPVSFESVHVQARRGDVLVTACDAARLQQATGWAPQITLEQTLRDTLAYWRAQLRPSLPAETDRAVPEYSR